MVILCRINNAELEKGENMVNICELKNKIRHKGLTVSKIANSMKIDRSTLYRKFNNNGEKLTVKEIDTLICKLRLTPEEADYIFLYECGTSNNNLLE